ncbi:MAG: Exodeoxyribonuclease 7 large subunit [Chlamydiales bacterium]|nr:Exodeoxyribonuclease 7 large subunit [Chlamydiales bacterium]MCH9620068.1 Exodeoxyribonuclease 7 large subunit [Chlamydiales bacterium]MCH9623513.1 Exodeoxyribonuclease 7 large subunit [Chlamydiales bacterium]
MSQKSTTHTVSELTFKIKTQLESSFSAVGVSGEISNFKKHSSGHLYFDLKDKGAKIPAVLFKGNQRGLERLPKEGDQVVVSGSVSVYPPHGRYQLIASSLSFAGAGELLLKLEALKKELQMRGWFDQEKKKPLPPYPKTIGVVTSPTGAVIRDIIHVLRRRTPGFHLLLYPVHVQGSLAAPEIAEAIAAFNRENLADVLIVGRGGGSLEDLWPFNEEIVAKAIYESEIPIISAVGHESDVTLADFVADVRAPTPSAAAEIVSQETAQSLDTLTKMQTALDRVIKQLLASKKLALVGRKKEAEARRPTTQISHFNQKLRTYHKQLYSAVQTRTTMKKQQLRQVARELKALDPQNVLSRGYSILFDQNHDSVIVSTQELTEGKIVRARLSDGEAFLCSLKKHLVD